MASRPLLGVLTPRPSALTVTEAAGTPWENLCHVQERRVNVTARWSVALNREKRGCLPQGPPLHWACPWGFPNHKSVIPSSQGAVNNSPSYRIPYPKAFCCCHVSLIQVMYISCKSRRPITYFNLANAGNIPGTDEGLSRCQTLPTDIFWRRINLTLDPMHELSAGGWKSSIPRCLLHCEVVENS